MNTSVQANVLSMSVGPAQYVWGGTGSSTTTSDYNLATNWSNPPAAAPPVAAGQVAIFANTGSATVTLTTFPTAPDSWIFTANAKSYIISGGSVVFGLAGPNGGIINNANAGQTIRISSNIQESVAGVMVQQLGNSTLVLTGNNTYTGGTFISAGVLQLGNGGTTGSIIGDVSNNGLLVFDRSDAVSFGGVISGSGAVNQIGSGTTTLSGINTYQGGTKISAGTIAVTNNSAVGSGTVTLDGGTFQAAASGLNFTNSFKLNSTGGSIDNNGNSLTLSGVISDGSGLGPGAIAFKGSGTTTLSAKNTYTGVSDVTAGKLIITLSGGITSNIGVAPGAELDNSGTINAKSGTLAQGNVANNGTFKNISTGVVTGILQNSALATNDGAINGGVFNGFGAVMTNTGTVAGGLDNNLGTYTQTSGSTSGGTISKGIINANGGAFNGAVNNNGGMFTVGGIVTSDNTFSNSAATSFLHVLNGSSYTVAGLVSNSGTAASGGGILIDAGGSLSANGGIANGVGATIVDSGTLTALTSFTNNGTVTGAGTIIGNLANGSGGIFAPGNGTPGSAMTVTGNLSFVSASTYAIQVDATSASRANVSGTATPGGASVNVNYLSGTLQAQYTILHANGVVSGTFNPVVVSNNSNINSTLTYDGNNVFLNTNLNFNPPPGPGGGGSLSGNQQNVANALTNFFNTNGSIPLVFTSLSPAGLTQLSGEGATASQQTTFDAMSQFMGLLTDPFISGRGDPVSAGGGTTPYAEETLAYAGKRQTDAFAMFTKAPSPTFTQRWSVWAAGFGGSQRTDGNAVLGSNDTRSSIYGTAVGADYRFSPNTIAGFALAGGGTNFSVNNLGSGRSDLFQAGAFVRHNFGPAYVTGALVYGWQDITTDRIVTVAGLDHLRAEFNANAWSGRVEGGYRFVAPIAGGIGVTPYAAGQFVTFDLPAYMEQAISGANTFALGYNARSVTDGRSELGLRTDKSFAMTNGIFTLRGRLAWAHDYDPDRNLLATFQTLPGASFVVNGATHAADSALTTASAEWKWTNGWSAAATFEGEFSHVTNSYAGKGVVRYAW